MELIALQQFCGGALQEKVNAAVMQVFENLQDVNTPWKVKRGITINIGFNQNEDRDDATVTVAVTTKLAPVMPIETRMAIGKALRTGEIYAEEYGKQIKGQMHIKDYGSAPETVIGNDVVDTDTGEVIGNVTDFRAREA